MSKILGRTAVEVAPVPEWIDCTGPIDPSDNEEYEVPAGTNAVMITVTGPVWFRKTSGATIATAPSGSVSDGTSSLYLTGVGLFRSYPGEKLNFFNPGSSDVYVTIGCYGRIGNP